MTLAYQADSELIRDAAGTYHVDILPASPWLCTYRWEGQGAYQAAATGGFTVYRAGSGL